MTCSARSLLLAALAASSVACGGSSNSSSSSTGGHDSALGSSGNPIACNARPASDVPVADASPTFDDQTRGAGLRLLDSLFGRIVRGDVSIYRGTAAASDNAQVLGAQGTYRQASDPNGEIPAGPAVASLTVTASEPRLVVHGLATAEAFQFVQHTPPYTWLEPLRMDGRSDPVNTWVTCTGCLVDLSSKPNRITMAEQTIASDVEVSELSVPAGSPDASPDRTGYVNVPLHVTVAVDLTAVPGCSVRFADLAAFHAPLRGAKSAGDPVALTYVDVPNFTSQGSEMVAHVADVITVADPSSRPGEACASTTHYTMDLFVGAENLSYFGVRSFVAEPTEHACGPLRTPATP